MPLYKVDIQKSHGAEFFTNVYYIEVATLTAGENVARAIADAEKLAHVADVQFLSARVSDLGSGESFIVVAIGGTGSVFPSTWLPLWNVLRVDLYPATGRPSRKYYRLPINEADSINGTFELTFFNGPVTSLVSGLANIPELRDVDGQPFVRMQAFRPIAMRQLRRGSRRRTQPIIPLA